LIISDAIVTVSTERVHLHGLREFVSGSRLVCELHSLIIVHSVKDGTFDHDPFVYMMPITDKGKAHNDFVKMRMGGVDFSGDSAHALLPADQGKKSPIPESEKKKELQAKILSRWPYIFLGCLVLFLALLGFGIWKCCQRRKQRREKKMTAELGLGGKDQGNRTYLELQDSHGYGNSQTKLNYYPNQ